jgi:hypothetical protein
VGSNAQVLVLVMTAERSWCSAKEVPDYPSFGYAARSLMSLWWVVSLHMLRPRFRRFQLTRTCVIRVRVVGIAVSGATAALASRLLLLLQIEERQQCCCQASESEPSLTARLLLAAGRRTTAAEPPGVVLSPTMGRWRTASVS